MDPERNTTQNSRLPLGRILRKKQQPGHGGRCRGWHGGPPFTGPPGRLPMGHGFKVRKKPFSQREFQIKRNLLKKKLVVSFFFQRGVPCCRVSRRGSQTGGPIGASLERRRWWRRERTVFPLPQPDVDQCGLRAGTRAEAPCRD